MAFEYTKPVKDVEQESMLRLRAERNTRRTVISDEFEARFRVIQGLLNNIIIVI